MCARRFLGLVFVLTLLAVAGAFALFQWGGDVLLKGAVPTGHFQASTSAGAPDYAQLESWLCNPAMGPDAGDPCRWQPGQEVPYGVRPSAQTFYIHPTTYLERDRWNAPLQPGGETEFRTRLFAESQASAFFGDSSVWAPRYRQAAFGAFLLDSADARKALDFAYRDVAAAFDQFVSQSGDGPIILAAHSQGSLHLLRLLREKVAGKPIAKRIVAAYVIGWPIDVTSDLPALGLPACTSATQAGCILSWLTFRDPANPKLIMGEWHKTRGFTGGQRRRDNVLCVNPITGTKDGATDRGIGGMLVPSANLRSATIDYNSVRARCDKGLLIVDGDIPPLGPYVLPGNNYHVYDYALFWGAIRRDAARRLAAWQG